MQKGGQGHRPRPPVSYQQTTPRRAISSICFRSLRQSGGVILFFRSCQRPGPTSSAAVRSSAVTLTLWLQRGDFGPVLKLCCRDVVNEFVGQLYRRIPYFTVLDSCTLTMSPGRLQLSLLSRRGLLRCRNPHPRRPIYLLKNDVST